MSTSYPTARLTLGQMRRSAGRLAAAGVAIAIGTAFVAVTLVAGEVITSTTYTMVAAEYGDADVVVSAPDGGTLSASDITALRDVGGVAAADPVTSAYVELGSNARRTYTLVLPLASSPRLSPLELADGAWPASSGEVALPEALAERLQLGVGDTVDQWLTEFADDGTFTQEKQTLHVTGVVTDPYSAYDASGGAAVAVRADVTAWNEQQGQEPVVREALVALDQPLHGDLPADVQGALAAAVPDATVQSVDDAAETRAAAQTGGQNLVFLVFVLTFAGVALLVAGLVIANTFQVLVAQRTRTLALLRCIGAGTGQLYRSVLLEAAILGAIASLAGVLLGVGLGQVALLVAPSFDLGVPLPAVVPLSAQAVLLPLAVGVVVTVVSALSPARAATRVAPLAALRPADAPSLRKGAGRVRAVLAGLGTVGGFALLAGGAAIGMADRPDLGLLVAVLGGAASFVGVVLGSVFWLPRVAAGAGALVGRLGPAARLAAANTLRNPRRTAATSTALLIGVTLVTMMSTGAASARHTADTALDESFPVDLMLMPGTGPEIPASTSDEVAAVDGVAGVAEVSSAQVRIGEADGVTAWAADADALRGIVRDPTGLDGLAPGTILLSEDAAASIDVDAGDTVLLAGTTGPGRDLRVVITPNEAFSSFVTPADLAAVAPDAVVDQVWGALAEGADPQRVLEDVQQATGSADGSLLVLGPAAQRAQFQQVVDVILGIVVGLLAVAVVIALIGVANTLSLSVIERTRESATLRAIGLSKGQLRGMLAVEGMLIAGVGAVLGILLGLVYGWAGAATALSLMGEVRYAVPWSDITAVVIVALVAGLVASVAPARAAVRTSPVAALAVE